MTHFHIFLFIYFLGIIQEFLVSIIIILDKYVIFVVR